MFSIIRSTSVGRLAARCFRALQLLAAAMLVSSTHAQDNPQDKQGSTSSTCVSPAMLRLMTHEGNTVRVSVRPNLVGQQPGQGENEQGIAATEVSENPNMLPQVHNWFEKGARKGYAPAQVNLAVVSLAGWGTRPNSGAALYWLREAAHQGYALAYFDLGVLYQNGCGVRQDYAEAFHYFEQGANAGDVASQINLGYFYDKGLGVARDRTQAAAWYRKAAEAGEPQAQFNLADLYVRGEGLPLDESAAFAWFQKAALQGHTRARVMLGSMYAQGRGTAKDLESAYLWLSAATLQGESQACAQQLAILERKLTPVQLAEAKSRAHSLAQSVKPSHGREFALLR